MFLGERPIGADARALRILGSQLGLAGTQAKGLVPVILSDYWTAANFDGDAFSTVGSSILIDVSAEFANAPANTAHIRAYFVFIAVRDSGTWGSVDGWFSVGPTSGDYDHAQARCWGGDRINTYGGWARANDEGDLYYQCVASDTDTLDVWLRILGYLM